MGANKAHTKMSIDIVFEAIRRKLRMAGRRESTVEISMFDVVGRKNKLLRRDLEKFEYLKENE